MSSTFNQTSMAHPAAFDQPVSFDSLQVETPEQVDLRFPIAGIGSRFLALLTDHALQLAAVLLVVLVMALASSGSKVSPTPPPTHSTAENWWIAGIIFFFFLLYWGYFSLFEAFWNGQTPGKRLLKIRVIKDSGRSITLFEALARNLLRIADSLPSIYLVGVITMLCNRSQKRLGDLVAGTIVVHERADDQPLLASSSSSSRTFTANIYPEAPVADRFSRVQPETNGVAQELAADAIARLKPEDLHLIDTFFSRSLDLTVERRAELAARVAATLSARMGFTRPEGMEPERMLETIAFRMRGQGRF